MLKLIKAALFGLLLPITANATTFVEGEHYEVVSDRVSKSPEVVEFFSFYCPACSRYEAVLDEVKPLLDKDVEFKKSHVDFVGSRDAKVQGLLAQAVASAEVLPQKDKLIAAMFSHFHVKRGAVNEQADIKDIFVAQGVTPEEFDKVFTSFAVRTKAGKMAREQKYYSEKRALKGVPTFIVNGKYRLRLTEAKIRDAKVIAELMNYLAKKK